MRFICYAKELCRLGFVQPHQTDMLCWGQAPLVVSFAGGKLRWWQALLGASSAGVNFCWGQALLGTIFAGGKLVWGQFLLGTSSGGRLPLGVGCAGDGLWSSGRYGKLHARYENIASSKIVPMGQNHGPASYYPMTGVVDGWKRSCTFLLALSRFVLSWNLFVFAFL